ncbi:hypothetical protein MAH1_20260 [Sessilibacter sp. MAH1]
MFIEETILRGHFGQALSYSKLPRKTSYKNLRIIPLQFNQSFLDIVVFVTKLDFVDLRQQHLGLNFKKLAQKNE